MIDDTNLETVIEKLSHKSGLTIANARNIITQDPGDFDVAEFLEVKPADLDKMYSGEASYLFAEKLNLTVAELQNLIDELGSNFITGIIFSKIMYDNE